MSATATAIELPTIANLTAEQKKHLLALLIKDELDQQPIPLLIFVHLDGEELGRFHPKIKHPAKTTLPPVPEGYWEEIAEMARNPGKTFTREELLVLEATGRDAEFLR